MSISRIFLIVFIILFLPFAVHADGKTQPRDHGDPSADANVRTEKKLMRREAMVIAEMTPEAGALYDLDGGSFVNCLEISVKRPCDTDWVTCIEDAWVVRFHVGEWCPAGNDGRMDLVIVVDSKDGHIISRYPEADYYESPGYCLDDQDCLCANDNGKSACMNFIHGQLEGNLAEECATSCWCDNHRCVAASQKPGRN